MWLIYCGKSDKWGQKLNKEYCFITLKKDFQLAYITMIDRIGVMP